MTDNTEGVSHRVAEDSRDPAELAKFEAMATEWWDPKGKFKPLHKFNPVRLDYIRTQICRHFDRPEHVDHPLKGLNLLDIGCGGGLLSEPMARLGAEVTGVDAVETNIQTARLHAQREGLTIHYRTGSTDSLLSENLKYDVILNMEVVEHVAHVPSFIADCAQLLAPGGIMFLATLNRTLKAFGLAIIGAEYVLGWLPRGTHNWNKFVTPGELEQALHMAGLAMTQSTGVSFNPLSDQWRLSGDLDVNYMATAGHANS